MTNQIKIFDTTLRDGQQSPGCGISFEANIEYALLAHQLKIDTIEAGFPAASQLDFEIVSSIATELKKLKSPMRVAALCQLREAQVVRTIEALEPYRENATLHFYLPVDPNLMQASLGKRANDHAGLIKDVGAMARMAADAGLMVEFSPEGYSNMGDTFDFVSDVIRAALANGVTVINCPDTIGGASEWQGDNYIVNNMNKHAELFAKEFPNKEIIWSIHCHNDFGLALANSMNAVFKGPARQIEGCINGVGERAGNTSLEQCIMYIKQFGALANPDDPYFTDCDTKRLQAISNFIAKYMMIRQSNSPIVGLNAARHSSGGHTNAVLNDPLAYQPFHPHDVGSEVTLVFGPMSGGNHAKAIVEEAGFICEDSDKAAVAQHIKDLFKERRKGVTDEEVVEGYIDYFAPIKTDHLSYSKQDDEINLRLEGEFFGKPALKVQDIGKDSAMAILFDAIQEVLPGLTIIDYYAVSDEVGNIQAECCTHIKVKHERVGIVAAQATDRDIQISAMRALIKAINKLHVLEHRSKKHANEKHY
jgi:2-isopropylmalate synthase